MSSVSRTEPGLPRAERPRPGERLELSIDSLAFGGAGVARREGYVVFVSGAVPGDRVRARITRSKRAWAEAQAEEILAPGPERIPARAQHPGAPWQVLPYERQLQVKQQQVQEALARIGRLEGFELEPIIGADERWRYRNKLEYSFGTDEDGRLVCGFHAPGEWQRVLGLTDCLLASEAGNAARERVLAWARRSGLRAHDRRTGEGMLRNLIVREGRRTGQLQVRLVSGPGEIDRAGLVAALPEVRGVLWTRVDGVAEVTRGGHTELLAGAETLEEELCGLRFRISAEAFFQTNTEMAEQLYRLVGRYAQLSGFERVYDLYCGIGTIALSLAPRAAEVVGLELAAESVADARRNARLNEIDNARFHAGDVRLALRELLADAGRPDVLVLDPPRAGLSAKVLRRVIEAAPRRIVYVSCNPTTLAPNAAQLVQAGWRLQRVRPVDMFPQTPHIECVALLERV
jgi:23S rRNA (uracil1939-C5)-methyltransferase